MKWPAVIFFTAVLIRFLYFPNDIYFGFDQARDAFVAKQILNGHLKIAGPPTTFEGLNHGGLFYYLYAPFYLIGKGDPAFTAAFLRVVNALGVFLIFVLAKILFNKYVGIIAALLFAASFEQTQFALYFSNPSFAAISVLIMFLGLAILLFSKKDYGLIIALAGLGLSIQFELLLVYLILPFSLIILIFRKSMPKLSSTIKLLAATTLFLTLFTFIISEIKFGFRSFHYVLQLLFNGFGNSLFNKSSLYLFEMGQIVKFNLTGLTELKLAVALTLFISFLILLRSDSRKQMIFLSIWFFSAAMIYILGGNVDLKTTDVIQYQHNVGVSLSLITFVSYLFYILWKRNIFLPLILLMLIIAANLALIEKYNPLGSMAEFNSQSFMLLSDEKKVLDYIYQDAKGKNFAVKGITLPFYINTTWSYLFEWYGLKKYGYLPVWNGINAAGYPGNLKVEDAQDKAPDQRYLIIEPTRGIPGYLISDYLREESYFSDIKKETEIGKFKIQVRYKK